METKRKIFRTSVCAWISRDTRYIYTQQRIFIIRISDRDIYLGEYRSYIIDILYVRFIPQSRAPPNRMEMAHSNRGKIAPSNRASQQRHTNTVAIYNNICKKMCFVAAMVRDTKFREHTPANVSE